MLSICSKSHSIAVICDVLRSEIPQMRPFAMRLELYFIQNVSTCVRIQTGSWFQRIGA